LVPVLLSLLALALKYKSSRELTELGLLAGAVGGLVVALGARRGRSALVLGWLLVAVGFGLVIIAVHFGVAPFRHHKGALAGRGRGGPEHTANELDATRVELIER